MAVDRIEDMSEEEAEQEARELVAKHPVKLPTFRLERIKVGDLSVDYAPPYGSGYARPLSEHRLRQLRRDWDPLAVSPLVISKRADGSLWVIDGNHRRCIAFEKGIVTLPAMIHVGLERTTEARLYTMLGTVLGQTPWTRFQAKLAAMDEDSLAIVRIAQENNVGIDFNAGYKPGVVRAVARVEWIYARGGPAGLDWVLGFLMEAFDGNPESLGELQLEGSFGFYLRYAEKVKRDEAARMLGSAGMDAWHDRAASIWQRIDLGPRSNTYGQAIADVINDRWKKQGKSLKQLLPAWTKNLGAFQPFHDVKFSSRMNWSSRPDHNPAPQQLLPL